MLKDADQSCDHRSTSGFSPRVFAKLLKQLTFCDTMNSSLPGSSVHGIFQARILEWAAISFSMEDFNLKLIELTFLV